MLKKIKKWTETIWSVILYPKIIKEIRNSKSQIIFIFPHISTGGGERVHADIMKVVADHHPLCLISYFSINQDMKGEFQKHSQLIDLRRWGWKTSFKKKMVKKVASIINEKENILVFGCGNHFFYDMLPHLAPHVKKVDLMHTFLGHLDLPYAFERYSIPVAHLIDKRIVLGQRHKKRLTAFYQDHNLDLSFANRVLAIHNKIDTPDKIINKEFNGILNALFVARNGWEKRTELFLEITRECYKRQLPIRFTMIGDFENFTEEVNDNVTITGKITNKEVLNSYYEKAHLILVTSLFEGFPMVLLEGMSKGVVPICTDVGVISDFVNEEKRTGFIIANSDDVVHLKLAFLEVIESILNNPKILTDQFMNVQSLIKIEFTEDHFHKKYREVFESLLKT